MASAAVGVRSIWKRLEEFAVDWMWGLSGEEGNGVTRTSLSQGTQDKPPPRVRVSLVWLSQVCGAVGQEHET